jgi:uncharacterized coiled-coil protein SlyX
VEEPTPVEVIPDGSGDGDGRVAALESQVAQLTQQLDVLRTEHRSELESVLRELAVLAERLRARLEA